MPFLPNLSINVLKKTTSKEIWTGRVVVMGTSGSKNLKSIFSRPRYRFLSKGLEYSGVLNHGDLFDCGMVCY